MLIMQQESNRFNCVGNTTKQRRSFIHQHLLTNHPPRSGLSNMHLLVLSCEHDKVTNSKQQTIALIKVQKLSNKSNTSHKNHFVLLGGNGTFPRLMFLSLKLVIGRHKPNQLARQLTLGVTPNHMANVIECNREMTRTCKTNLIRDQQNIDEAQLKINLK